MNHIPKKNIKILSFVFLLQTFFLNEPFTYAADQYCDFDVVGNTKGECFSSPDLCSSKLNTYIFTRNSHECRTVPQVSDNQNTVPAAQTGSRGYTLLADIPTVAVKTSTSLPEYMKGIIVAAIGLAIVFAVLMIVIGGIQYIVAQTPFAMGDAKKRIGGAILGLILALLSYLILQVINPELLNIGLNLKTIVFDQYTPGTISERSAAVAKQTNTVCIVQKDCTEYCDYPSSTSQDPTADCTAKQSTYNYPECSSGSEAKPCVSHTCSSSGGSSIPKGCGGGNGKCQPLTIGICSVENLSSFFGDNAEKASTICNAESGGNPLAGSATDKCRTGEVFSYGLFQINLTQHNLSGLPCAHNNSASPFTAANYACTIKDSEMYGKCAAAAKTARVNIEYAKQLSNGGSDWHQWSTGALCGL